MASERASELLITVGMPPTIRVDSTACALEGPALRAEDVEELMRSITPEDSIQRVCEQGSDEFGFAFGNLARFLVRVFREKGTFGIVLRRIG